MHLKVQVGMQKCSEGASTGMLALCPCIKVTRQSFQASPGTAFKHHQAGHCTTGCGLPVDSRNMMGVLELLS